MKESKVISSKTYSPISKIKFSSFLILFFLFVFIQASAQEKKSNEKQWKSAGGQIVFSGKYQFKKSTEIQPPKIIGGFTVRGPGFIGVMVKKIGSISLRVGLSNQHGVGQSTQLLGSLAKLKGYDGWVWEGQSSLKDFVPNANAGGWVTWPTKENPTTNLEVWVSIEGDVVPEDNLSIEYEYWFFPREGGKVIKSHVKMGYIMAIIGSKDGTIERLKSLKDQSGEKLKKGDVIYEDDILITNDVMVKVILDYYPDKPLIMIKPNTKIRLEKKVKYKKGGITAFFGKLLFAGYGKNHKGFKIIVSNAIVGCEGTEFEVNYDKNTGKTTVTVYEGLVNFSCLNSNIRPMKVSAGITASLDKNCVPSLNQTDPSINTAGKAGWDNSDIGNSENITLPITFSQTHGTARLLTVNSNQDIVGRNETLRGNGKTDAIFRAQFSAPNRTITAVEVSNTNGLRSTWDTRPNNRLWLGGVVNQNRTMSQSDGSVNFSLDSGQNTLDFFVEDNGSIRGGETNYRMTIFFASGEPLIMDIGPANNSQGTARLLTVNSNQDMVGRNETLRGNGKTDAIFRAQFSAPNRTITAVEVSNTNGLRSTWDTRPNNRLWLGGVVNQNRTMSQSDGSVNFSLDSGQNTLDFFVEDNGSIRGGETNYRMTIFFASGEPLIMDIGPANSSNTTVDGQWKVNQHNGYDGTLTLQQNQSGRITGTANWNQYDNGTINGQLSGNSIEFTISYASGDYGKYTGTVTQNGIKMNGTVLAKNGASPSWDASKVTTGSNTSVAGQWQINQHNGYDGTLTLQQNQSGRITGTANWNQYDNGTIDGQVSGNSIEFTIRYASGDYGKYSGTITQNGIKMNGTVLAKNGASPSWNAYK